MMLMTSDLCWKCRALPSGVGAEPLNVLLILSDDLRPDLGAYGGVAKTPNLDALANATGAVRFDRAYVQQAICCPSRSSFLLGRRPDTTRVWDLTTQFRDTPGADKWLTLPQFFRSKGYVTAGMGKVFHPLKYKNETDDVAGGSWTLPYYHGVGGADTLLPLSATNCGVNSSVENDTAFTDGMIAAHAASVLRNVSQAAAPFFVAVGFHRPHLPWVVPNKYFELYPAEDQIPLADFSLPPIDYNVTGAQQWSWDPQSGPRHCAPLHNLTYPVPLLPEYGLVDNATARHFRRSYWAAVSQMDRNVGVVLDTLRSLGLENSTVVAFAGDHGWQLGDLGEFGKKTNFERATRAPLIIRDPSSRDRRAAASSALVEFVDIMPTLIDLAMGPDAVPGACPGNSTGVALCTEGRSLREIMADPAGTTNLRTASFMQYASCMHDEGVWHDACAGVLEPNVMGYAVRTRRWRYVEWVRFNVSADPPQPVWAEVLGTELYDHTEDDSVENMAEAVNVVARAENLAVVQNLSQLLRRGPVPQ